jgi:hypothetical protein
MFRPIGMAQRSTFYGVGGSQHCLVQSGLLQALSPPFVPTCIAQHYCAQFGPVGAASALSPFFVSEAVPATFGVVSAMSPQVAYEVLGRPRSLLEAAAAKGFHFVTHKILDLILADMGKRPGSMLHHQKVSRILDLRMAEWGWSRVDIARAMMHVLPGSKPAKVVRMAPAGRGGDMVWDDIPSILAALEAHAATAEDVNPTARTPHNADDALYNALGVVESQERKSSSARVSRLGLSVGFSPVSPPGKFTARPIQSPKLVRALGRHLRACAHVRLRACVHTCTWDAGAHIQNHRPGIPHTWAH